MVIQRWQSVLLLVAAVMMGCFTFLSLGQVQTEDFSYNISTLGLTIEGESTDGAASGYVMGTAYLFVISLMATILPFIDIFLFKNPRRQRLICIVEVMFIVTCAIVLAVALYTFVNEPAVGHGTIGLSSMIIAPLLALIATVWAYRRIGKDIALLESVDRLR